MLLGTIAALKRNSRLDYGLMTLSMTGVVVPAFVLAPILVTIFAIHLGWLPAGGWEGGQLAFLVLPVLSLAIGSIASIARVMRGAMIETLNQPYIRTAKAKGLSTAYILFHHALRPSLIPVVAMLGPAFRLGCHRFGHHRYLFWYWRYGATLCLRRTESRLRLSHGYYSHRCFTDDLFQSCGRLALHRYRPAYPSLGAEHVID